MSFKGLLGIRTYPEALLSVSREIPLRDSGGGDITGEWTKTWTHFSVKHSHRTLDKICPLKSQHVGSMVFKVTIVVWDKCPLACVHSCVYVLLSREEREDFFDRSIGTAPGGSITGWGTICLIQFTMLQQSNREVRVSAWHVYMSYSGSGASACSTKLFNSHVVIYKKEYHKRRVLFRTCRSALYSLWRKLLAQTLDLWNLIIWHHFYHRDVWEGIIIWRKTRNNHTADISSGAKLTNIDSQQNISPKCPNPATVDWSPFWWKHDWKFLFSIIFVIRGFVAMRRTLFALSLPLALVLVGIKPIP